MAVSGIVNTFDNEVPLLVDDVAIGVVDFKGRPVNRPRYGRWRSASFIIGVEVAERFAYYGVSSNLINYLTGPLGQSTPLAAENVNAWSGTASLLPLVGGFVADHFLGRYCTIILASVLYILSLGLLTLSAVLPSFSSYDCLNVVNVSSCSPPRLQVILFFFSLYLFALAQGGHKPCAQAFGADQFDDQDPDERKAKSSFFNWWYFCMCGGVILTLWILNYIQENLSWALGFGIPCIVMVIALLIFLLGTMTYRFNIKGDDKSPFVRIGQVFVKAAMNWRTSDAAISIAEKSRGSLLHEGFQQFKFLNKALLAPDGLKEEGTVCSINDVEEAKAVLRLIPIWASCLVFAIVYSQQSTLYTKQAVTMDRSISSGFKVPAATLQSFTSIAIAIVLPIYDCVLVPIARSITRRPSGITMLQRIGTGLFLSLLSIGIAALVEIKRLATAVQYGLVDEPTTIPMKVWWLLPQFFLFGAAEVFTMVGLQEFFYDQMPSDLRSIGLALYLSIFGVGSFLSSFLISIIEKLTSGDGKDSWFSNNLNRAHLDYFYWLLTGFSLAAIVVYLYFSKSYVYNRGGR